MVYSTGCIPQALPITSYRGNDQFYEGVPLDSNRDRMDLTGSTITGYVVKPDPTNPLGAYVQPLTLISGFIIGIFSVQFEITEADLAANGLGAGTYGFEILATNDGGVSVIKPFFGVLTVPSFLRTAP